MATNYTDTQVQKHVSSGRDAKRAADVDAVVARAQAGDRSALTQLQQMAGLVPGYGLATADAKDYARMQYNKLTGSNVEYLPFHDGGGFLGSVGGVLKTLAPAAALIPGIGPLAAAGIAAGANSVGSLAQGNGLDVGGSLKDALLSYGGAKLMGGGGGGTSSVGNATQSMVGAATPGASSGGGVLSTLGRAAKGAFTDANGSWDLGKLLGTGASVAGYVDERNSRKAAQSLANAQLDLRKQQLAQAEDSYNQRQPLRDAAFARLAQLAQQPIGGGIYR